MQTYLINNFGSTTSLKSILKELHKSGMDIKRETLNRYINILMDAKIIYECKRFDLKSINGEQKYYLSDMGFYFATNTDNRINYGPALENVVFNYAKSKGYDISIGRIGKLECDFIMRDNMNGGQRRSVDSLSGGETFLTSLSLALALSSQIQLKGNNPLEFFFLDEGFGTLDENLLEVVMSSLERIHNDKLKVGIISHVESIKNRVPVKLLITPAEAGMGGSKVKIERS